MSKADEIIQELGYGIRYKKQVFSSVNWCILENDDIVIRVGSHGLISFDGKHKHETTINSELINAISLKLQEKSWREE